MGEMSDCHTNVRLYAYGRMNLFSYLTITLATYNSLVEVQEFLTVVP